MISEVDLFVGRTLTRLGYTRYASLKCLFLSRYDALNYKTWLFIVQSKEKASESHKILVEAYTDLALTVQTFNVSKMAISM